MNPLNAARGSRWSRLRYQLLSGFVIAILLPFALRYLFLGDAEDSFQLYTTAIGSSLALIAGLWTTRNITTYPGVEATSYVVPAISAAYGILFVVLIVGRIPYNRALLMAGWIVGILWYLALYSRTQRYRKLRIGVVPPCDPAVLKGIAVVEAVPLAQPSMERIEVDAIMADLRIDLPAEWDGGLADYALAGIPVYHLKHLMESLTGRVELEHLSENSFGSLTPLSPFMVGKTVVDWILALMVGIVLLPFFLIVAILIRATSSGPVLFRQQRIGYRGQRFTVYKFRTMSSEVVDSDRRIAAMTKSDDARVTRIGQFLRRTRIDELPQIINILRGEMSWIGPRPEAEVLSKWYESEIPFYRYRHIVLPGITGWAQVNQGHVTDVGAVKEKLYFDFYYIKKFSLWIDLLIINRTISTVLSGFGAR